MVITFRALMTFFMTLMLTLRALTFMMELVATFRAFIPFYLTFMLALWTLVAIFFVVVFTVIFSIIHLFTSLSYNPINNMQIR